jgi:hypothetical protein
MRIQTIALAFASMFIWGCGGSSGNVPLVIDVSFTGSDTYDGRRTPITVTTEAFAAPYGGTNFAISISVAEQVPVALARVVLIEFADVNPEPGTYEFQRVLPPVPPFVGYTETFEEGDRKWTSVSGSITVISNDGNVLRARLNNVSCIASGSSSGTVILDGTVEVPIIRS